MDIVIVTFNRARYLAKCLSAIAQTTRDGDCVLTVDNCSTDDTRDIAANYRGPGRYFYQHMNTNRGCAGGRNYGFKFFDNPRFDAPEFIAMFDDDIKVRPGWQDAALSVFAACADAGVVGLIDDHRKEPLVAEHEIGGYTVLEKTFINTAGCVIRREAFESIGGYHESDKAMDWISTRFCKDLRTKDYRIFVTCGMAENMDHPKHKDNERDFYAKTGYEAFRREGKKRRVKFGDEARFFQEGTGDVSA